MPVTIPRALSRAAQQVVVVINEGDRDIWERFDGQAFHFPPRSKFYVPAERAWLWFGDPSLRSDPQQWDKECTQIQRRVGDSDYNYRLDGKFYCREFGKGREYYKAVFERPKEVIVAIPLDDDDDDAQLPDPKMLVAVGPNSVMAAQMREAKDKVTLGGNIANGQDDMFNPLAGMTDDQVNNGIKRL